MEIDRYDFLGGVVDFAVLLFVTFAAMSFAMLVGFITAVVLLS